MQGEQKETTAKTYESRTVSPPKEGSTKEGKPAASNGKRDNWSYE